MQPYFFVLAYTCGLMTTCTMIYSYTQAQVSRQIVRRCIVGLGFGSAGILAMLQPLEIEPGVIADARGAFVGMATAFGGPVAAAIAVALTVAARVAIGGSGAALGAAVILITTALAGLWLHAFKNHQSRDNRAWIMLALSCAVPTFIALHSFPAAHSLIGIFFAGMTTIVVFSFGKLLHAEQHRGRRERQLAHAASTDALTGLPNRRAFEDHARQLEETGAQDVMLLLLDVDHFKAINDELGHDGGDNVLQDIAKAIRNTVRDTDFAARIGGEEFAVIVELRDATNPHQIAERFRAAVQIPYGSAADRKVSTVSVGGFCLSGRAFSFQNAYKHADEALYRSKRAGRNLVTLFPSLQVA